MAGRGDRGRTGVQRGLGHGGTPLPCIPVRSVLPEWLTSLSSLKDPQRVYEIISNGEMLEKRNSPKRGQMKTITDHVNKHSQPVETYYAPETVGNTQPVSGAKSSPQLCEASDVTVPFHRWRHRGEETDSGWFEAELGLGRERSVCPLGGPMPSAPSVRL